MRKPKAKAVISVKATAETPTESAEEKKSNQVISDAAKLTPAKVSPSASKSVPNREPQTMEELLSQTNYAFKSWQRGQMLTGTITSISNKHVVIDIGGKSEAIIHEKEIPYIADILVDLKAGETVSVYVVNPENDRGQTVVSLRRTAMSKRWELLAEKLKKGEAITVTIKDFTKGGFLVDYMGLRGFIPLSQVDAELSRAGEKGYGRRLQVKIIEADKNTNRLVLSQLAGSMSEAQKGAIKAVEIGKVYPAQITGVAPFGAFVSVKISQETALPGLIHISEIAWEKVENVGNYFKVGQTVEVKVINVDKNLGKLTLSVKQLLTDPWQDAAKMLSIDQIVKGKVTRVSDYGVFVQFLPGIEGLVHISKLSPGAEPKVGEEVECTIEEIIPDKRKISLSMITHAKPIGYR